MASSTTARSNNGERADAPNGALTASTLCRMWNGALNDDVEGHQLGDEAGPAWIVEKGCHLPFQDVAGDRGAGIRSEHRRKIVVALLVRTQIAPLAAVGCVRRAFCAIAEELGQQHGKVLGPAETRVATLAVQDRAHLPGGFTKQQRVGNGERIADRIAQERDGLIEVPQDDGRRQLHDVVPGPAMLGDARAEGQLVRVLRTERHRIGENLLVFVETPGQRDDQAGVEAARQERPDRPAPGELTNHRGLELRAQLPPQAFFVRRPVPLRRQRPEARRGQRSIPEPHDFTRKDLGDSSDQRLRARQIRIGQVSGDGREVDPRLDEAGRQNRVQGRGKDQPRGSPRVEQAALADGIARQAQRAIRRSPGDGEGPGDRREPLVVENRMPLREVIQRAPIGPAGVEIGDRSRAGVIENLSAWPKTSGQRVERRRIRAAGDSADAAADPLSHGIVSHCAWGPTPTRSRSGARQTSLSSRGPSRPPGAARIHTGSAQLSERVGAAVGIRCIRTEGVSIVENGRAPAT